MVLKALILGLALLIAAAFGGGDQEVPFKVYKPSQEFFSRVDKFKYEVIRSEDNWKEYWKTVLTSGAQSDDGGPIPAQPSKVDWSKNMLVAIHLGPRPTTGFGLRVDAVRKHDGAYTIHATELPRTGGMAAMHVTYPFVIIRVPAFKGEVYVQVKKPEPRTGHAGG